MPSIEKRRKQTIGTFVAAGALIGGGISLIAVFVTALNALWGIPLGLIVGALVGTILGGTIAFAREDGIVDEAVRRHASSDTDATGTRP